MENEVQERKMVELDARPSDCMALAVRAHAPIYVVTELWNSLTDVSETLEEMRRDSENS
jgi:bifunctional DNase/RNase